MTSTSLQIQEELTEGGFRNRFLFRDGLMWCVASGVGYAPNQLSVLANYRFEGNSDPDDEAIIWVLKAFDGTGGIFIDAFGPQADPEAADFLFKLADVRDSSLLMDCIPAFKTIEEGVEN
jgi:hypothetical protein